MPKSRIIIELIDDLVPLEKSLTRLLVLAKDTENDVLYSWVSKELQGYNKETDSLPEYRKCNIVSLLYSGINGKMQVNRTPLPSSWFTEDELSRISDVRMYDGISRVYELKQNEQPTGFDCTNYASLVSMRTAGMVSCTSIFAEIPKAFLGKICECVKEKALLAFIELEKKYGVLDDLFIDISREKKSEVQNNNEELNKLVLNINFPSQKQEKEPWYSKITWRIMIPIITTVGSSVITYIITKTVLKGNS